MLLAGDLTVGQSSSLIDEIILLGLVAIYSLGRDLI
jgi:hypothetical protein